MRLAIVPGPRLNLRVLRTLTQAGRLQRATDTAPERVARETERLHTLRARLSHTELTALAEALRALGPDGVG